MINHINKYGERYDYKGYNGCDCHCYIKVVGNAVLCTEAKDNEGTSITNMAETLATLVCREYDIPFEEMTWVEHYEHEARKSGLKDEVFNTYDLVTFTIVDRPSWAGRMSGKQFVSPQWKPADREYVREVFGV